jgi:hypothetical protein
MPDDPPLARAAVAGPGGHQHVPAVPAGVSQHPRIPPPLIPARAELLIPAGVGLEHRRGRMSPPGVQVRGRGQADALLDAVPDVRAPGIKHEPRAVRAADHRAGPGRRIVKRRARRRGQYVGSLGPVDQVFRRGMADGDIAMPQFGISERARGLEKEHMKGAAVIGEPEIPDPRVSQSQHGAPFLPGPGPRVRPPDAGLSPSCPTSRPGAA